MPSDFRNTKFFRAGVIVVVLLALGLFFWQLRPAASSAGTSTIFEVTKGESVTAIADDLAVAGLVRSRLAFELLAVADGVATSLHPGLYRLDPAMSSLAIARTLATQSPTVTVTIPEGWNVFQIDRALSDALVIKPGALIKSKAADGPLFPDTYQFRNDEEVGEVVNTMIGNFKTKTASVLDRQFAASTLVIASLLEKEAKLPSDQKIIAGIIKKRLAAGIPLGLDASVCYAKQLVHHEGIVDCAKLTPDDFKIFSPYNTYTNRGLPPGPIGNPGTSTIIAAQNPTATPYWYYLSDPQTGKIIYAKTLEEQTQNIRKYLR